MSCVVEVHEVVAHAELPVVICGLRLRTPKLVPIIVTLVPLVAGPLRWLRLVKIGESNENTLTCLNSVPWVVM